MLDGLFTKVNLNKVDIEMYTKININNFDGRLRHIVKTKVLLLQINQSFYHLYKKYHQLSETSFIISRIVCVLRLTLENY